MGRRLGLIIGVNSYQDTAFQPLQYAETDARAIAQWLVNTKGGNWSPPDVQLLQGAYATRELVETLITQLCVNVAGPGDLVLIYFAGHAFLDEMNGDGYLALANTRYQQPTTGIRLSSLAQQTMGRSQAAHVLFMFDCFQTGKLWSTRRSTPFDTRPLLGPTLLNALQQRGDRLIFCSCRGNEFAAETGEKTLGVLTYRMIVGLCGAASDPATKQTTLQRLHAYLFSSIDEQHRPQLFGQERTALVLAGEMPQNPVANPASEPPSYNGQLPSAYAPGGASASTPFPQSPTAGIRTTQGGHTVTATAQLSPTTTGQLMLPTVEQQCTMLLRQARHLIQMQNPAEAFKLIEQALHIVPTNVAAIILKAQLLGSAGRSQEALYAVEQAIQLDSQNALAWSLRAALLTNTGQYQQALQAIEHSLELDPNNPETYSIKTSIMGYVAAFQNQGKSQKLARAYQKQGGSTSFFIGAGIQLLGLILGTAGAALPVLRPSLPIIAAFVLQSLGLSLICVNAVRTSYLYGFVRFLLTLIISGLVGAALAAGIFIEGVNHIGTGRIYLTLKDHPDLLLPLLFLGLWLALAAAIPPLLGLVGLIAGLVRGVRRKKS